MVLAHELVGAEHCQQIYTLDSRKRAEGNGCINLFKTSTIYVPLKINRLDT